MQRIVVGEDGLSLIEILVATFVLTVGLLAVGSGFQYALGGISAGGQHSVAVFLAEQRLEQIKADALNSYAAMGPYAAENYGTIVGYPHYRRAVTLIVNPAGTANTTRVQVSVFYNPQLAANAAQAEREYRIDALVAQKN